MLAPVPFYEHPGAMMLNPVMRHPDCVWARWVCIASGNPDITSSIPAVITGSPDITLMRRWTRMFHNNRRRRNADNDLRKRWRSSKGTSKYSEDCEFLHGLENLHLDIRQNILLCLRWFYEVERERRKIVALVSQVEKCRNKKMGCSCSFQKCGAGISTSSGTIRATNRRDVDDHMK
jgi:hypothetical protein